MYKLCRNESSKIKLPNLHYVSDKNHNDSKLRQKVIILKVLGNILHINYILVMFNFGNLIILYSNTDI